MKHASIYWNWFLTSYVLNRMKLSHKNTKSLSSISLKYIEPNYLRWPTLPQTATIHNLKNTEIGGKFQKKLYKNFFLKTGFFLTCLQKSELECGNVQNFSILIIFIFRSIIFLWVLTSEFVFYFSCFQKPSLPWLWINRRRTIDVKFLSYGTSLCTSWIIGPISSKETREQLYFLLFWGHTVL